VATENLNPKPIVSDLVIDSTSADTSTVSTTPFVRLPSAPEDPSAEQTLRLVEEPCALDFWIGEEQDASGQLPC
jgi:hypothetical protein